MPDATISLKAVDRTRGAFLSVDQSLRKLSKSTQGVQSQLMGAGVGILGAGTIFTLATRQVRQLIQNIDEIPGIPEHTRQGVRDLRDTFANISNTINGPLAAGLAFIGDAMASVGTFLGVLSTADFKRLLNPFTAGAEAAAAMSQITAALDAQTQAHIETLRAQSKQERDLAAEQRAVAAASIAKADAQKQVEALAKKMLSAQESFIASERAYRAQLKATGDAIRGSVMTPLEEYTAEVDRLGTAYRRGAIDIETFNRAVIAADKKLSGAQKGTEKASKAADEMGWAFSSAFEDAVIGGGKLSEVLKGLAQDVMRIFLRNTITAPLGNFLGGLFGGARADGGPVGSGKSYLVGERGPEIFTPSSAGKIIPNDAMGSVSGRGGNTYNIDARGADQTGLARLEAMIRQTQGSIRPIALQSVFDASARGMI